MSPSGGHGAVLVVTSATVVGLAVVTGAEVSMPTAVLVVAMVVSEVSALDERSLEHAATSTRTSASAQRLFITTAWSVAKALKRATGAPELGVCACGYVLPMDDIKSDTISSEENATEQSASRCQSSEGFMPVYGHKNLGPPENGRKPSD